METDPHHPHRRGPRVARQPAADGRPAAGPVRRRRVEDGVERADRAGAARIAGRLRRPWWNWSKSPRLALPVRRHARRGWRGCGPNARPYTRATLETLALIALSPADHPRRDRADPRRRGEQQHHQGAGGTRVDPRGRPPRRARPAGTARHHRASSLLRLPQRTDELPPLSN